jgi:hypothetical protein
LSNNEIKLDYLANLVPAEMRQTGTIEGPVMARGKKHSPEQIVSLLREIEVAVANEKTTRLA